MISAVIADDSAFLRKILLDIFNKSGIINVVGMAKNGKEAVELVMTLRPDVLILDIEMPIMNGLEALQQIMRKCPLPVFIFSSHSSEGAAVTIKALEYGAANFLLKPEGGVSNFAIIAQTLIEEIKYIVLHDRIARLKKSDGGKKKSSPLKEATKHVGLPKQSVEIIAMGSSTGGVRAGLDIVPKLPAHCKPIIWVQHMPAEFTKRFAEQLDTVSSMRVKEAEEGDTLEQGVCYIAKGGVQMRLVKKAFQYRLQIGDTQKVSGHCPSCDVLFNSVAEYYSNNAVGVILTGMGNDGMRGLVRMHSKGTYIIGQNEDSCVVYGMPRSAHEAGAVDIELDVHDIADAIMNVSGEA